MPNARVLVGYYSGPVPLTIPDEFVHAKWWRYTVKLRLDVQDGILWHVFGAFRPLLGGFKSL